MKFEGCTRVESRLGFGTLTWLCNDDVEPLPILTLALDCTAYVALKRCLSFTVSERLLS